MLSRRSLVKGGAVAVASASVAGTLGGCASKSGKDDALASVFKFFITDPVAIDPYNSQETQGSAVTRSLFDALTAYDWERGEIVPLACESWEANEDATEFTFHLIEGARFHNGDPVDAASFKRAWERVCNPNMPAPSEVAYHLDPVQGAAEMLAGTATELSGVSCPDDLTLKVKLISPMGDFPYVVAHPALSPVPQAAIDDRDSFLFAPIGNGPFKMNGQWESGQYIYTVANDDYYGTKPKLSGVYFSIQKDSDTAFREFEAGNMDCCDIPTGRVKELMGKYGESEDGYTATTGKQVINGPQASVYYLCLNLADEVISNKALRQAMNLAIDRQAIIDQLYEGTRVQATSIFPTLIDDDPSNAWEYATYDPERAKQIIEDNGLSGTSITLSYNSGGGHEDLMSMVQAYFQEIGIKVTQSSQEWAAYLSALGDGSFQVGRLGWTADYPTMDNFLYPNFYSTADNNYSKYNNAEVDARLLEARKLVDEEARKAVYREINQMVAEDLPIIPIMYYSVNKVASSDVQKFYFDAQNNAHFETAEMVATS